MSMGLCELCGEWGELEKHHIFAGRGMRKLSERYGATVKLCPWCHRIEAEAVHNDRATREKLQDYGQRKVMREQGWTADGFRAVFGKNYLIGDEDETEETENNMGEFRLIAGAELPF